MIFYNIRCYWCLVPWKSRVDFVGILSVVSNFQGTVEIFCNQITFSHNLQIIRTIISQRIHFSMCLSMATFERHQCARSHPIFGRVIIFPVPAYPVSQHRATRNYLVRDFAVWSVVLTWNIRLHPDISTAPHTGASHVGIFCNAHQLDHGNKCTSGDVSQSLWERPTTAAAINKNNSLRGIWWGLVCAHRQKSKNRKIEVS